MTPLHMNTDDFRRNVHEGELPVLIEFQAPWCTYCRRIIPAMAKVAEQRSGSLVVGQVNIDDEPQLAASEQIEVVPTLILYQNGKVLGSIVAPESKAAIDRFLEASLAN